MAYLPSMFRIHTSSSSKNISGPSRFSMSLKPLQGTYEEDIYKQASITSNDVVVTLTHKSEWQRKMVIFMEVVNSFPTSFCTTYHGWKVTCKVTIICLNLVVSCKLMIVSYTEISETDNSRIRMGRKIALKQELEIVNSYI